MNSPSKTEPRKKTAPNPRRPFSDADYYTTSVKLFHSNDCGPTLLTGIAFVPMPAGTPIRGFVCKAARTLLGQTQDALASAADISRKTLFDFEIGEIEPKMALINRIRKALEDAGANFVTGNNVVGVVVYTRPTGGIRSRQA